MPRAGGRSMSGLMRGSDLIRAVAAVALICAAVPAVADPPRRVVSMNLCTDQLAMLLAAPGQLLSVSTLAADPRSSAMADRAADWPLNHGRAEEVYLMRPDLVIAGSFTARATVDMLRRLGTPVEVFAPTYSLDDVRDRITRMGEVLGRPAQAAAIVADFDANLAAVRAQATRHPRAALFEANGYTSGDRTLAGQILRAAGFVNVAAEAGYADGGVIPLEVLAMSAPDAVITSRPYPGGSRAEEIMDHPVVQALRDGRTSGAFTDSDWVCGTPFVLRAIADMAALRRQVEEAP